MESGIRSSPPLARKAFMLTSSSSFTSSSSISTRGCLTRRCFVVIAMLCHVLWLTMIHTQTLGPLARKVLEDRRVAAVVVVGTSLMSNSNNMSYQTDQASQAAGAAVDSFVQTIDHGPDCSAALDPVNVSFTLVGQCDDERVPMIAQHCLRWNGHISVAVLSERSAEDIMDELVALNCTREQLHVETLSAADHAMDSYPVNHLRNAAIKNVHTSHIVYLDIDFLPSSDLELTLRNRNIRKVLADDSKQALVIPAFEYLPSACPNCTQEELLQNMPRTKRELMLLRHRGAATMFHEYWPVAHDSTDYAAWTKQVPGTLHNIPCIKANNYEPYLVVRKCQQLPPFQEAFAGYGYNKASFTMQLQAMHYTFRQVGGVFCTHFPHEKSKARQVFDLTKNPKQQGKRREIADLVKDFARWLNQTYGHVAPLVPYCGKAGAANQTAAVATTSDAAMTVEKATNAVEEKAAETFEFADVSQDLEVCRKIEPEEVSYTLVTQCSDDRLWMMEHHCQRWAVNNSQPHISLVVYTNETAVDVKEELLSFGCSVDTWLTVQTFPQVFAEWDYPVNEIRNQALAVVKTTHAIVIDIDFWVSTDLPSVLDRLTLREKLAESHQNAIVVPAFQLQPQCTEDASDEVNNECQRQHIDLMPSTKDERMLSSLKSKVMTVFNILTNVHGHGSTRYDKWMNQSTDDELHEIDCVGSNRYEPYLVVRACQDLPPFQPFTGYGQNKITWIMHLRRKGWRMFQLSRAFVVHFPHPLSKAKLAWRTVPDKAQRKRHKKEVYENSMRVRNERHFAAFKDWLNVTVVDHTAIPECDGFESK